MNNSVAGKDAFLNAAMLRWVSNSAPQGIFTTDAALVVVGWNHWMEAQTGRGAAEVVGRSLFEVYPELIKRRIERYYRDALTGQVRVLSQKLHKFLLPMPTGLGGGAYRHMQQSARISPLLHEEQVIGTVTVINDVTDRVAREAELQEQLELGAQLLINEQAARAEAEAASEKLRVLQTITDAALEEWSLDTLLEEFLERIRRMMQTDIAAILLSNADGDLVVRAAKGLNNDAIKGMRLAIGEGFNGRVAEARRPLVVEDVDAVDYVVPVVRAAGLRSVAGVPLLVGGSLLGVLNVGTRLKRSFSEDDVRMLELVADRVALLIEHARLYEAEQHARRQAEEANRLKDEFLATVSHELRTPLTAILGWSRMLIDGRLDAESAARALETVERNARAQSQLIEDILDVSRIISGKLRLDVRSVNPTAVIEAAVESVRLSADAKQIRLQLVLDTSSIPVSGDEGRLQQVVWNLLSNAIKFTPKEGTVRLVLRRVNSHVEIVISDNGQGIEPDLLPYIFDRFRQADSSTRRQHAGLGLGLAIVRNLVELHGGTVEAESEGLHQGATFTVRLPLMATRASELFTSQAEGERAHPTVGGAVRFDYLPRLDGLCVLVVDDEADTRILVASILEKCDAQVVTAGSAAEALAALERWRPDVVVSDIGMPEEDGYSLIGKIRELPAERGGQTPAAALTAYARVEDRMRVLRSGFQIHVTKPVEPAELVTVVANLAGRSGKVS